MVPHLNQTDFIPRVSRALFAHDELSGYAAMTAVVLMGVCGSGKTVVGQALATEVYQELIQANVEFADADSFHPEENVTKMSSGIALTDEDRMPWLMRLHERLNFWIKNKQVGILACSALKKSYRDILQFGFQTRHSQDLSSCACQSSSVVFVYLKGSYELISYRMEERTDHYMPASLLKSQFRALEEPGEDEPAITVSVEGTIDDVVQSVLSILKPKLEATCRMNPTCIPKRRTCNHN